MMMIIILIIITTSPVGSQVEAREPTWGPTGEPNGGPGSPNFDLFIDHFADRQVKKPQWRNNRISGVDKVQGPPRL